MPAAATFILNTSSTTDLNWISIPLDQSFTTSSDIINSTQYSSNGNTYYKINFVSYYDVDDQVWKGYALYYPDDFDFTVSAGMGVQVNLLSGPYTWPVRVR